MSSEKTTVAAYYKFVNLPDFEERRAPLLKVCEENGIKGTILLAAEGINSTMAGPDQGVRAVLDYLQNDPAIGPIEVKYSYTDEPPFYRMKVRLKKEIVRLGMPEISPNDQVGEYVDPKDWNDLISDPNVVVVDTRNDYEVEIGTFKGAINPNTKSFREFPEFAEKNLSENKEKAVAMFCTGGIRCEKSTSYLLNQGFKKVYHLKGGILNYLEKVDAPESLWEGDCFVFDNRVTVTHDLAPGGYDMCHACRHAITAEDRKSPKFQEGVSCPYCYDSLPRETRQRAAERQKQIEIHQKLDRAHIGMTPEERDAWRQAKIAQRKRSQELAIEGEA